MTGKRGIEFDPEFIKWAAELAQYLSGTDLKAQHSVIYHLPDEIPLYIEGEPHTGLAIVRSEFSDDYVLATWTEEEEE